MTINQNHITTKRPNSFLLDIIVIVVCCCGKWFKMKTISILEWANPWEYTIKNL